MQAEFRKKINDDVTNLCTYTKNGIIYKLPIIDWTDEDIDKFVEKYNVPLSKAYTQYRMKRTGCCGCPYGKELTEELEALKKYEPIKYKTCLHNFKDIYIIQDIDIPSDKEYQKEKEDRWNNELFELREEMLKEYAPDSILLKKHS